MIWVKNYFPILLFVLIAGLVDEQTDQSGAVFVNGLAEGLTRFEVDETSLPSIYIKPYEDYTNIIPRSGATTILYMGFEQLGEIDGFVYAVGQAEERKPIPGVELVLIDADTRQENLLGFK